LDKETLRQLVDHFDKCGIAIAGKYVLSDQESLSRFSREMVYSALELSSNIQSLHADPNVRLVFAISLLTAAWSGCIPRAKLFETAEKRLEHDGKKISDEELKNMDETHRKEWCEKLTSFFNLGRDIAKQLRLARSQDVYDKWLTIQNASEYKETSQNANSP